MTSRALSQPLIDRLLPIRTGALRIPLQITAGVALMALLAQLRLELGPVPITGQTLGVLLIGAAYGMRLGGLTMLAYLLAGGLGLSVFTGAGAGWSYFTGATAGYLFSFPVAAALVGYLAQRGWDRKFGATALAMLLGNILIYLPGLLWLAQFAPEGQSALLWSLGVGFLPFVVGDIVKLLIAVGLLPTAWKLLGKNSD